MGGTAVQWLGIQRSVADHTRAVAYDRSGLGASDPDTEPRTLSRAAADLSDLLDAIGADSYVLVGHSWGGPIVRRAAAPRSDVGALVLVDPTDERSDLYFDPKIVRTQTRAKALLPWLARTGLTGIGLRRLARKLPVDDRRRIAAVDGSLAAARGMQGEYGSIFDDLTELRDRPPDTAKVPTTIISGTRPVRFGKHIRRSLADAHRSSVAAHPDARHVEATRSAHMVHLTEPAIVAREILRTLSAAGTARA